MPDRLKDVFFTRDSIGRLADRVAEVYPAFDRDGFLALVFDAAWESRELKARMRHVARCLGQTLPPAYSDALDILVQVAPHITGFDAMVCPDFVEVYGQHDWERSMPALGFFTQFSSSEFAVRPFLHADPERGMVYMRRWAEDPNHHVRRLASEGCRPRLPWAMALPKFKADPTPILPILEKLKDDESDYVRRSVANNLNDIAKDHPELVLAVAGRWLGHSARTDGIVKHGCRSLLKAGNQQAMALFGYGEPGEIEVSGLACDRSGYHIGEDVVFAFELRVGGTAEQSVRLEYAVDFVKTRGRVSRKVFKLVEKVYAPGVYPMRKRHSTADRTTRTHYPGRHGLVVIVNGQEMAATSFELRTDGQASV